MIARFIIGVPLAVVVTLSLFMLMRFLISSNQDLLPEQVESIAIDITRAQRDESSEANRELDRPDVEDQPPPPPPMDTRTERPDLGGLQVGIPDMELDLGGGNIGPIDGEIQPLVRVPPEYPLRAAERGVEGTVCMEFTVNAEGNVENPEVYRTDSSLLNRAAMRAVSRFRYQPRIVDGNPVPRPGVTFCVEFRLGEAPRR